MSFCEYGLLFIYVSSCMASIDFHRSGWLDKVVQYYKNKLFEDFRKVPDVELKASIQLAPEGYVDSPDWNVDSVTRLLILIRQSKSALPVRRVLRRMLGNSRRKMSFQETFKYFPSLGEDIHNELYYDTYSSEIYADVVPEVGLMEDKDRNIILVSNPVEARLPSAMISISLLRKILEERAKAARYMPTTRRTIPWKPMTKTTSSPSAGNDTKQEPGASSTGKPESNTSGSTGNTGAAGTGTAANNAATTAAAA